MLDPQEQQNGPKQLDHGVHDRQSDQLGGTHEPGEEGGLFRCHLGDPQVVQIAATMVGAAAMPAMATRTHSAWRKSLEVSPVPRSI